MKITIGNISFFTVNELLILELSVKCILYVEMRLQAQITHMALLNK